MASSQSVTFNKNLRGYLGAARSASTRLVRATRSLSSDPVEPIDAVFSTISENYDNNLTGDPSTLRQLLASDVIDSLIQIQGELSQFDEFMTTSPDTLSGKAVQAYVDVRDNFSDNSLTY